MVLTFPAMNIPATANAPTTVTPANVRLGHLPLGAARAASQNAILRVSTTRRLTGCALDARADKSRTQSRIGCPDSNTTILDPTSCNNIIDKDIGTAIWRSIRYDSRATFFKVATSNSYGTLSTRPTNPCS